jgi:hypothetical protein
MIRALSRTNPWVACQLCGTFHPYDETTNVPLRDSEGKLIYVLFCQNCLKPRLTYIQGLPHLSISEMRMVAFALVLAYTLLMLVLASAVRGVLGAFMAIVTVAAGSALMVLLAWNK